jgi:hypothetical protein
MRRHDHRRERLRQGGGGPRHPQVQRAPAQGIRGHQLRRHPREPARERTLRPREGQLHRRGLRSASAASSSATAARFSSTRSATCRWQVQSKLLRVLQEGDVLARRRQPDAEDRRAHPRRHQQGRSNATRRPGASARTCFTGSTWSASTSRRCANAARTCCRSPKFFLQRLAREQLPPHQLSEEAIRHLEEHHWPGNVRELENTLQRACVLATADVLLPKDIPLGSAQLARPGAAPNPRRLTAAAPG